MPTGDRRGMPPPPTAPDQGVAWHYGDPLREQRLLAQGRGAVDLSHWSVLEVAGEDRIAFLDSLTSQRLTGIVPPESRLTLLLSPHGHVEYVLRVVATPHSLLLIIDESAAPPRGIDESAAPPRGIDESAAPPRRTAADLHAYLQSMVFLSRATITDRTEENAVVFEPTCQPDPLLPTALVVEEFSGRPVPDRGRSAGGDPARYVPHRPALLIGREVILPRGDLPARLGAEPAGTWALEALRIAAGIPRLGLDTDDRTLPHEVGWVGPAVHLEKGCYRGQETVARVHNLGRPPRRLVLLHCDGSHGDLPQWRDAITADGAVVGSVGSVVQHYELGPLALGLVKAGTVADGDRVSAGGVPATVESIVVAERSATRPRPPRG